MRSTRMIRTHGLSASCPLADASLGTIFSLCRNWHGPGGIPDTICAFPPPPFVPALNTSISPDDIRWLVGPEGSGLLAELSRQAGSLAALAERLKRRFSPERVHLALAQIELRRRAAGKFPDAQRMFFLPETIQQATDFYVARYKARLFPAGEPVAEICCGIGGDLLGLAARGPVTAVDLSDAALVVAEANVRRLLPEKNARDCQFCAEDARQSRVDRFTAWHIDPDRRAGGRRTTRLENDQPGPATIDRLLRVSQRCDQTCSGNRNALERWQREATGVDRARPRVPPAGGVVRRSGRQAGAPPSNDLAEPAGPFHDRRDSREEANLRSPVVDRLGRYVFDPDSAVIAAGLTGQLARQHALAAIHPAASYLTGDDPIDEACLQCFEVTDELPFDRKRLRALVRGRGIGRLEIKVRGVEGNPDQIRRELHLQGSDEAVLLIARAGRRVMAILARRIKPRDGA